MTRSGVAIAIAIACAGCDAMEWNFVTPDAAVTEPPSEDATVVDESTDAGSDAGAWDAAATDAHSPWPNCLRDGGCRNNDLHCNEDAGLCVPCFERSQCPDNVLNHCDLKSGDLYQNLCVECTDDSDCNSSGSTNGLCLSHQCVVSCMTAHDCTQETPTCGAGGFCVLCTSPSNCRSSFCSPIGRCVDCDNDSQCKSMSTPRCDLRSNTCVACLTNADCGGGFCDPATSSCSSSWM